jgi:hypothetical protein
MGGPVDAALFANVGDDSEHPASLDYVRNVMQPWAAERGLPVHELHKETRDGQKETLWGRVMREGSRSEPIPIYLTNGSPGSRSCTSEFKIRVVGKWLKANGADADDPAIVAIGISTDEMQRANNKKVEPYERPVYPLLQLGLNRGDCINVIADAGLPVPPKSSCFFCPFHSTNTWVDLRRDDPELFDKAQFLEDTFNERRAASGKGPVHLTRFGRRLSSAIPDGQDTLFEVPANGVFNEGKCDDGYCWT